MPRKWIAQRIGQLDPEVDYQEIVKLSTTYRPTPFVMNLIYSVTFPHFFVRELDALPLFDGGGGKVLTKPDLRADDTAWKMLYGYHHGAESPATVDHVEKINRLHTHYAKTYRESFSQNGAYIYTLCYEAAGIHRLQRRIGMKGLGPKEQKAHHRTAAELAKLFRNVGEDKPLVGFPETFEGVMAFMDEWEGEAVPRHAYGPILAQAMLDQFANRYVPKPLRPAAQAWVISLYPEHIIAAYGLKRPSPPVRGGFRLLTKALFLIGAHIAPDPTDTFEDRRQAAKAEKKAERTPPATPLGAVARCPHLRASSADAPGQLSLTQALRDQTPVGPGVARPDPQGSGRKGTDVWPAHSHSIVPGGLDVTS